MDKKQRKKKKSSFTTILLIVILLVGLSLVLYPTFSNYWNSLHQTRAIANYVDAVDHLSEDEYATIWQAAVDYNNRITTHGAQYIHTDEQMVAYNELLNIGGSGIMGYIEIPTIDVSLPIYHGTSDGVLQVAAGHLDWTSLPVGGESSHCVLSGHRGLPSARLFTDLDQLVEGDVFVLRVLNEVLTYEVDQILIVLPEETEALQIVEGKDYCTLLTCTPYGINTHRLLVRGHRIETAEELSTIRVTADAVQVEALIVAPVIAIPILLILVIAALIFGGRRRKNHRKGKDNRKAIKQKARDIIVEKSMAKDEPKN